MNRTLMSIDPEKDCLVTATHCHPVGTDEDGKKVYGNEHFCGKPKGHNGPHECASCDYTWRNIE